MPTKRHLDRNAVVRVAAELADQHGLEALTLASVAAQLGIRIPSLYNYVAGLPGLRREMAMAGLRQMAEQLQRAAVGKARGDAILAMADAYRAFAHAHPGLYAASMRTADIADSEMAAAGKEVVDVALAVLQPYGLSGSEALHIVRAIRSILHGFVDLEAAGGFGLPLDCDETFRRLIKLFIDGLQSASETPTR